MALEYYNKAFGQLKEIPFDKKSEGEKVLEYFTAILLQKENDSYVKNELYNSIMREDAKSMLDFYLQLERTELLKNTPVWYIKYNSM